MCTVKKSMVYCTYACMNIGNSINYALMYNTYA